MRHAPCGPPAHLAAVFAKFRIACLIALIIRPLYAASNAEIRPFSPMVHGEDRIRFAALTHHPPGLRHRSSSHPTIRSGRAILFKLLDTGERARTRRHPHAIRGGVRDPPAAEFGSVV